MSRKRKILWTLTILAVLYVVSYSVMSFRGHFKPMVFGLIQGSNGEAVLAPKSSQYSYYWYPFEVHGDDGGLTVVAIAYYPLLMADRRFLHRSELAESGRFRVKNYFDRDMMEYREVKPN